MGQLDLFGFGKEPETPSKKKAKERVPANKTTKQILIIFQKKIVQLQQNLMQLLILKN